MNAKLAEWIGNRLERLLRAVRMHCSWDEERRRKRWPLAVLHGLQRGSLVETDEGMFELLEDAMTVQRSSGTKGQG